MPSWNVHIAHAEDLLKRHSPHELGINDWNAFLLGCLLPDVYVGYMVQPLSKKLPYRMTHLADTSKVPLPDYETFASRYVYGQDTQNPQDTQDKQDAQDAQDARGTQAAHAGAADAAHDLILGTWCHLMADHTYNAHTRVYLAEHHIPRGEKARIGKQGDLQLFGQTFDLHSHIEIDSALLAQAHAFPAYEINDCDLYTTSKIVDNIVKENAQAHLDATPAYTMLDQDFFEEAFEELKSLMERNLLEACGA